MKRYYVEGLYLSQKNLKKMLKGGSPPPREVEPFARSFWAENPADALSQATEALEGGQWLETPKVSLSSEEKRMRQAGAPELPGFSPSPVLSGKKNKKKN